MYFNIYRYDEICEKYIEFKNESIHKPAKPLNMVKLVFTFLSTRTTELRDENIIDITRY